MLEIEEVGKISFSLQNSQQFRNESSTKNRRFLEYIYLSNCIVIANRL